MNNKLFILTLFYLGTFYKEADMRSFISLEEAIDILNKEVNNLGDEEVTLFNGLR